MNDEQKIELLNWIAEQDKLRIETLHYMGGKKKVSVWTITDDEDEPSGTGKTVLEALNWAKQASEA